MLSHDVDKKITGIIILLALRKKKNDFYWTHSKYVDI